MINNINQLKELLIEFGIQQESLQIVEDQNIIIALASSPKGNKIPLVFQLNEQVLFVSSRDLIQEYPTTNLAVFFELSFKIVGYKFYTHPSSPKLDGKLSLEICSEIVLYEQLPKEILYSYIDIFYDNVDEIVETLSNLKLATISETQTGNHTLVGV
jgi:hypothetical protein